MNCVRSRPEGVVIDGISVCGYGLLRDWWNLNCVDRKRGHMLEGFYGGDRKVTMGSHGRGHLDPQAMLWSRSLRGTHDSNVRRRRKEMEAKRRDRVRRIGVLGDFPEVAPGSASRTRSSSHETPSEWPARRPRPKSAEVQGAKKLLRMLHLDHMLSDDADDFDVAGPEKIMSKKKVLKGKGTTKRRPSTSSKKVRPKDLQAPSPVRRDVSPLTSWRMDPSLPESLREKLIAKRDPVTMSSQKAVKVEPAESEEEEAEEEEGEPHVTQWRYKLLPGESVGHKETRKRGEAGQVTPKSNRRSTTTGVPHFDLDDLRVVVVAMQKEHRQCIRSVAESLEHHTRQIVLLTKANSSLADHVEHMEKELKVLRAMQFVCTTIP